MKKDPAVVPIEKRDLTQVDILRGKIKEIHEDIKRVQALCGNHDYRLLGKPTDLPETLLEGVLDARMYDSVNSAINGKVMHLKCMHCSHEADAAPYGLCPECLTPMPKSGTFRDPKEVFGRGREENGYGGRKAEIFECTSCGCRVAKLTFLR